jgi:hypothetical protein
MTDEQLGRAWCERHGRAPDRLPFSRHWWGSAKDGWQPPESSHLPDLLLVDHATRGCHRTEAAAYAAVGAAGR